ncbi:MAG: DUF4091 domain-containing protein [Clostridia bacterium]|nr:DUF4091 domain-containing protein [Clostridia bacterium]
MSDLNPASLMARGCVENPLSVPSWSFYDATAKVRRTQALEKTRDYTMYLAKNEREYCQLVLQLRSKRSNLQVSCTDFTNEAGDVLPATFCEEFFLKTSGNTVDGTYPEQLIPVKQDHKLEMEAAVNYPYYIGVRTTADTVPGDYTATVKLTNADQPDNRFENLTVEVRAHVWDFTLPEAPCMDTAMGLEKWQIAREHGVDANSEKATQLYKAYYEFLLDHGISAYNLPVDILTDEADAYMSDPRCTSFCVPYGDDDTIRAYYEKLSSHPEWLKKAYFYPIDEPTKEEDYERYREITDRLAGLFPDYNMVTPFYVNEVEIDGGKQYGVDLQDGRSSIMCPETVVFDEKGFAERAYERQANGDKLWWYVCCGPGPKTDYCNLFTQQDGIKHRILFWQQKQYNVTGLLYWSTSYWCDTIGGPWASSWTTPWTGVDTYGDGVLVYPGRAVGIDGPVSGLRLEAVANGIEDYAYLCMAQELLGEKYVSRTIARVTKDLTHYTLSEAQFAKVRVSLGEAIEKAYRA